MTGWRMMARMLGACAAVAMGVVATAACIASAQVSDNLRAPPAFSSIGDRAARSRALFAEAAKVITMNCHPAGNEPSQGDDEHVHKPAAFRGDAGIGVPGLPCASCHTDKNFTLAIGAATYQSIPGHPRWGLAPLEMAWQGKTPLEICRQIKDPARNGGRSLALLQEHMAKDGLVGWAWHPGPGRRPAPGTQDEFGAIIAAWIETGAECP